MPKTQPWYTPYHPWTVYLTNIWLTFIGKCRYSKPTSPMDGMGVYMFHPHGFDMCRSGGVYSYHPSQQPTPQRAVVGALASRRWGALMPVPLPGGPCFLRWNRTARSLRVASRWSFLGEPKRLPPQKKNPRPEIGVSLKCWNANVYGISWYIIFFGDLQFFLWWFVWRISLYLCIGLGWEYKWPSTFWFFLSNKKRGSTFWL